MRNIIKEIKAMKAIEKRLRMLEERINVSKLPTLREYMEDYEDKYHDVDLDEILKRENKEFNLGVIHQLIARKEKIKEFQQNQIKAEDVEVI